jgi:uncharacterized protein YaeQ
MAIGSTMYTFTVQLANVDRGVYEDISLRVARHPSETDAYMVTRILAYCLEHEEGIEFGGGVSTTDEPAVLVRDLTGHITAWIEVGAPDAARLHTGSKLADRTVVYTHRDPVKLVTSWAGKPIHGSGAILLHSFDRHFIDDTVAVLERRNTLAVSLTEGQLYVELNGVALSGEVHTQPVQ